MSASRTATSVSGFCLPVSTSASLIGAASGRKASDSVTDEIASVLEAAVSYLPGSDDMAGPAGRCPLPGESGKSGAENGQELSAEYV
jgi:hypothetical protein